MLKLLAHLPKKQRIFPALLIVFVLHTTGCDVAKNKPKKQLLNQLVLSEGSCTEYNIPKNPSARGLFRIDVVKNLNQEAMQVVGKAFMSKKSLGEMSPWNVLGSHPSSPLAAKKLDGIDLGLSLGIDLQKQLPSTKAGKMGSMRRDEFKRRRNDSKDASDKRGEVITLKNFEKHPKGYYSANYQDHAAFDQISGTEEVDGFRGMGPYVSVAIETKIEPYGVTELLIPSDPEPDDMDYSDPKQMPKGIIGKTLNVPYAADPNNPASYYGDLFHAAWIVVEFQGTTALRRPFIRRCVAKDTGKAGVVEIPLEPRKFIGIAGEIRMVIFRQYQTISAAPDETGGEVYFQINSAVLTGGTIIPAPKDEA